jgi:hypothetical protein
MLTKTQKVELLNKYVSDLAFLKPLAETAFGARDTASHAHQASRKYTELLKEYADLGGSLIMMSKALEVTYPALRRRVMTADVKPLDRHHRSKATPEQYAFAVATLTPLREGPTATEQYHDALLKFYDEGISINRLARELGLKSAYPLYYGINKARMRKAESGATHV